MNKKQLTLIEDTFGYASEEAIRARRQLTHRSKSKKKRKANNWMKVMYIRLDGMLFVQLHEDELERLKNTLTKEQSIFIQVPGSYSLTGMFTEFTETGILLKNWEIERW